MDDEEFVEQRRNLSAQTAALLVLMFRQLGSWRDPAIAMFLSQALPLLQAAQEVLGQLTAVYITDQATAALYPQRPTTWRSDVHTVYADAVVNMRAAVSDGTPVDQAVRIAADQLAPPSSTMEQLGSDIAVPVLPRAAVSDLRHGVSATEVYTRPFSTVYAALADGRTLDESVERGATRLEQIVETDLQHTYAQASDEAMRRLPDRVRPRYWARILQGSYSCALCVIASTQRYHVGNLNPIHAHCDCLCKPLAADDDPGQVIAPGLLERAHAEIEAKTGRSDRGGRTPDYRKHMIDLTGQHSEVGTLLRWPGDHFTTGGEIP